MQIQQKARKEEMDIGPCSSKINHIILDYKIISKKIYAFMIILFVKWLFIKKGGIIYRLLWLSNKRCSRKSWSRKVLWNRASIWYSTKFVCILNGWNHKLENCCFRENTLPLWKLPITQVLALVEQFLSQIAMGTLGYACCSWNGQLQGMY